MPRRLRAGCLAAAVLLSLVPAGMGRSGQSADTEPSKVERDVVFGRYGGLALLMDVHRPRSANGFGVIYVPGSGFHTPLGYDARPITVYTRPFVPVLLEAGYTVFAINHRAAPAFRHPAALEDCRRAVRWVRHGASAYGIRADRLAAAGYSSGGTLASLLGVSDAAADPASPDEVERQPARVQCVVAGGAAFDFASVDTPVASSVTASYLGATLALGYPVDGAEARLYREASPVTHVDADDAAHFILHGDADEILPFKQAELMTDALRKAGVPVTLMRIPGGSHGKLDPPGAPDYKPELVRFLAQCLGR
jgi:acetyl esterase/lipase